MNGDRWISFLPNKFKNSLITITTLFFGIGMGNSFPIYAQITPDTSLGAESSVVTPDAEVNGETADRIDGGAIRDRNLFHSFDEFNVGEAQQVYFANPDNIEQIFTRITGSNPSNINGTLGVDGAADLLLLNPNGIIFGENSSLDVEGSFFGTSADSVLFEDETEFSAVQPNSLLTISVPVGIQVGNNPGLISVRSPLEVGNGQNFTLVGGAISLSGGDLTTTDGITEADNGITAPGGRVELGSLSNSGIVSFDGHSNLAFPQQVPRANITLEDFTIDAGAGGEGSITIFSQNLRLTNSLIITGIDSTLESTAAQAGDITIDTTEATILEADENRVSGIFNITGDLSQLSEAINESDVINTAGNAGDILINTDNLSATGFSVIASFTNGAGNAGNIDIIANSSVSIDFLRPIDSSATELAGITSSVAELGTGNGADIQIDTPSLSLNNSVVSTNTIGEGNAGSTLINTTDSIVANNSLVLSETLGLGNGGNIQLNTGALSANNTFFSTSTIGEGNAGNTLINATDSIDFLNSSIEANTFSSGDAGNILLVSETADISFEGSGVTTSVLRVDEDGLIGTGRGGNVSIKGRNLFVTGNSTSVGFVSTATDGEVAAEGLANAGDLNLDIADSITLSNNSVLFADTNGEGNAGDISITTNNLTLLNTGQIRADTLGAGEGGNIAITAGKLQLTGNSTRELPSSIFAQTSGSGNGGMISITAENLLIGENAFISVGSNGTGSSGSITARISDSVELENGVITSSSLSSSGGEIDLTAGSINLQGNSNIQTNVGSGEGGGGNITLTADSIVAFDDSDIVSASVDGRGGNITLNTDVFFGANFTSAALNANLGSLDNNSRVDINASGSVFGIVDIPNVNFLPNNLVELSEDRIDADEVVANSCVVRRDRDGGTFIVTGSSGIQSRPGDAAVVDYATGSVRSVPENQQSTNTDHKWQSGDPIVEPDKAYRLSNGKLVLSRKCS